MEKNIFDYSKYCSLIREENRLFHQRVFPIIKTILSDLRKALDSCNNIYVKKEGE